MNNSRVGSLYDLMETKEEMALLVVKEQLSHYIIRKVVDEECENLLTWWKTHESYLVFVAPQILGIVGSQIEAKRVFNIVGTCTNM